MACVLRQMQVASPRGLLCCLPLRLPFTPCFRRHRPLFSPVLSCPSVADLFASLDQPLVLVSFRPFAPPRHASVLHAQGVGKVVRLGQGVGSGAVNGTFASGAALRTALSRRSTTAACRSRHHICRESAVRGSKQRCRHANTTLPTPAFMPLSIFSPLSSLLSPVSLVASPWAAFVLSCLRASVSLCAPTSDVCPFVTRARRSRVFPRSGLCLPRKANLHRTKVPNRTTTDPGKTTGQPPGEKRTTTKDHRWIRTQWASPVVLLRGALLFASSWPSFLVAYGLLGLSVLESLACLRWIFLLVWVCLLGWFLGFEWLLSACGVGFVTFLGGGSLFGGGLNR